MPCFRGFLKLSAVVCLISFAICLKMFYNIITTNSRMYRQKTSNLHQETYSYLLWKSVNLKPADKTGNATHRRYGDPIQLYTHPGERSDLSNRKNQWVFDGSHNHLVDCRSLFLDNGRNVSDSLQEEIASSMKTKFRTALQYTTSSCDHFVHHMGYITSSLTSYEASFPIAYSILVFKDVEQFEVLLRAIYRPQNVYCVHIDKKSAEQFRAEVEALVGCFDNVFVSSQSTDVQWGQFSVLEPEINCLKELWESKVKWKYFINLTGQEMPLRTNYELVKLLTSFDGANNVEAVRLAKERLRQAGPVPHGVNPVKGAVHVVVSRSFVDFLLHNEAGINLLEWSRKVDIPDEIYFSTLNHNKRLGVPGSYRGVARTNNSTNPFLGRLKNWRTESTCHGKYVHDICIFGTKDLPLLATREELFANKMHFDYHPEVSMCMQELLYNRTADEYHGLLDFDVSYYASRDFVRNKF